MITSLYHSHQQPISLILSSRDPLTRTPYYQWRQTFHGDYYILGDERAWYLLAPGDQHLWCLLHRVVSCTHLAHARALVDLLCSISPSERVDTTTLLAGPPLVLTLHPARRSMTHPMTLRKRTP
jgi:hypothetical protein